MTWNDNNSNNGNINNNQREVAVMYGIITMILPVKVRIIIVIQLIKLLDTIMVVIIYAQNCTPVVNGDRNVLAMRRTLTG